MLQTNTIIINTLIISFACAIIVYLIGFMYAIIVNIYKTRKLCKQQKQQKQQELYELNIQKCLQRRRNRMYNRRYQLRLEALCLKRQKMLEKYDQLKRTNIVELNNWCQKNGKTIYEMEVYLGLVKDYKNEIKDLKKVIDNIYAEI